MTQKLELTRTLLLHRLLHLFIKSRLINVGSQKLLHEIFIDQGFSDEISVVQYML